MSMDRNTFLEVDEKLSQTIYRAFYTGSVINRKEYMTSQAQFVESKIYLEIRQHENHYIQLYRHLGYELIHDEEGEFFSIKLIAESESEDAVFDETSLKIIAILTLISRIMTQRGQPLEFLGQPVQGITGNDVAALADEETTSAIFKALKLKTPIDALEFIKKRGFAFRISQSRYVLSKGAMTMIDTLIEREKELSSSVN
ncbi:condensin complex protein MksE [Pseudoalteromonas luteoviolacea]|uniref:DUF4194 domain-containing protein n=1 Tax=Pseudoalteromonas luteoviolacea H33 TaxID=1365251 RepID=A0A167EGA8_9GAMM|nr:hypothetical protein [Pseudoalteromonas luteoviolacea]KZN50715.1 hypothetical protein N476_15615 [Pseudoalteromonas luteoviolacea H33]KZN77659.1 hypothetical protein N477_11860 [Pseudoalteromonas luteoviolacea H33-S]